MNSNYSTIIILKEVKKKLKQARDKYKEDHKDFSTISLSKFYEILLDYYEKNEGSDRE